METPKVGSRLVTWGLVFQLAWVGLAEAAPVIELELDGTATNNSAATAQAIPRSAFTLPVPSTVFDPPGYRTATISGKGGGLGFDGGPSDVDIFRIVGSGGLVLDIDSADLPSFFDTILSLFNGSGLLLAVSDDNSNDPGSVDVTNQDSLIFFTLPGPGVYFVAVTQWQNFPCDLEGPGPCFLDTAFIPSRNGPQPDEEAARPFLLHVSLQHPIPLPPTGLLVGSVIGLAGLVARRWRCRACAIKAVAPASLVRPGRLST